jgi:hypothetical protein
VALLADNILMLSSQGIVGAGMAESGGWLPGILPVAFEAIVIQLSLMLILMARKAFTAKSQERPVYILDFDLHAGRGGDVLCGVTLLASEVMVFALQDEAGLGGMVEGLAIQARNLEFLAVMLHMTTATIRLAGRRLVRLGVKALVGFQPAPNLDVTLDAFETAATNCKIMTGRTLGHALQLLVSACQRTRRDLSRRRRQHEQPQGQRHADQPPPYSHFHQTTCHRKITKDNIPEDLAAIHHVRTLPL